MQIKCRTFSYVTNMVDRKNCIVTTNTKKTTWSNCSKTETEHLTND